MGRGSKKYHLWWRHFQAAKSYLKYETTGVLEKNLIWILNDISTKTLSNLHNARNTNQALPWGLNASLSLFFSFFNESPQGGHKLFRKKSCLKSCQETYTNISHTIVVIVRVYNSEKLSQISQHVFGEHRINSLTLFL